MQICAPVKRWVKTDLVDLLEVNEGKYKVLYDGEGRRRYIDVDWQSNTTPDEPYIVSYHNYGETPPLEPILAMLQQGHPHAQFYKIATMAISILDSLRMLEFQRPNVIGICMGE